MIKKKPNRVDGDDNNDDKDDADFVSPSKVTLSCRDQVECCRKS